MEAPKKIYVAFDTEIESMTIENGVCTEIKLKDGCTFEEIEIDVSPCKFKHNPAFMDTRDRNVIIPKQYKS